MKNNIKKEKRKNTIWCLITTKSIKQKTTVAELSSFLLLKIFK